MSQNTIIYTLINYICAIKQLDKRVVGVRSRSFTHSSIKSDKGSFRGQFFGIPVNSITMIFKKAFKSPRGVSHLHNSSLEARFSL